MRRPTLARASFYAATLLVQVLTFNMRPTPIYRAIELDAPTQLLGAIGASFAVVPLLLAVGIGTLTDRLGEKALMITGGVVLVASTVCFALLHQHSSPSHRPAAPLRASHLPAPPPASGPSCCG